MEPEERQRYLKTIPAVEEFLRHPLLQQHLKIHSKEPVVAAIRKVLEEKRQILLKGAEAKEAAAVEINPDILLEEIMEELAAGSRPSLHPVINATGVILHTNLGRAPLGAQALDNICRIAKGYTNLELDLETGERGSRYAHVEEILCRISGAESALVVNNNAGAVFLSLNSLAEGKEVIVSRGQLVEIGGAFRIPDVMSKSGARLVEVGTTNRTHLKDYEQAIGDNSALLLKVHTSNFRILGFTAEVSLKDLVALGHSQGLPVMEDLGSGCFVDLAEFGLEKEPTVQEVVKAGADVVTFSGDKLLGGPQAGIVLGRKKYLDLLKRNPLHRALRIDKLTLAGMETTLRTYLNREQALREIPVLRMLNLRLADLERRARRLRRRLLKELGPVCEVSLREENSRVGGGALPMQAFPTRALALRPLRISAAGLEKRLRKNDPPILSRVQAEEVLLDLRTVGEGEEDIVLAGIKQALKP